jgi:hypothetical protein
MPILHNKNIQGLPVAGKSMKICNKSGAKINVYFSK